MDYGHIIKRSWSIAWRYKALWVLGIFAGVSGCQPGSNSPGSNSRWTEDAPPPGTFGNMPRIEEFLPILIVAVIAIIVLALLWFIVSVAAEAGLIHAVNRIERAGDRPSLREAWGVGWRDWGRVFAIRFLLGLPMFLFAMVIAATVAATLAPLITGYGRTDSMPMIASLAGAALCGAPIMIVVGLITDILRLVAVRYAVLGDRKALDSIRDAWRAFRAKWQDHVIAYLIGGALNLAASILLAIPLTILAVVMFIPAVVGARMDAGFESFIGVVVGFVALLFVLGLFYSGIWGTFTSAYWTLFFRDLTGMRVAEPGYQAAQAAPYYGAGYGVPGQGAPGYGGYPPAQPPAAPYPPAQPPAPPYEQTQAPTTPYPPAQAPVQPTAPAPADPYAPAPPPEAAIPPPPAPPAPPAPPEDR